jgi:hypothetical protein
VDVGTGYYIEKTLPKAKEYLEKKIAVINTNAESVAQVGRKLPLPPSLPPSFPPSFSPSPFLFSVVPALPSPQPPWSPLLPSFPLSPFPFQVLTQKEKSLRMVSGYFQKKLMVMSQTSQARQAQRAAQGMS